MRDMEAGFMHIFSPAVGVGRGGVVMVDVKGFTGCETSQQPLRNSPGGNLLWCIGSHNHWW